MPVQVTTERLLVLKSTGYYVTATSGSAQKAISCMYMYKESMELSVLMASEVY